MEPTERLDERTADAVLRGHLTVTDLGEQRDLAELGAFAHAVRTAASVPGRPNHELARVLAEGLPTPVPAAAAGTVAPTSRSKRMIEIVAAKLAAAGLAAKAGLATAAVVAGTAGAGAAGMLPGELQTQLDALRGQERGQVVVDADDAADEAEVETTTTEDTDGATVTEVAEVTDAPDDLEAHDHRLGRAFGERTSADAQDGGVDGEAVADEASEGRSTQGRQEAAEASDGRSETGSEAAERRSAPEEIPAERPEQAPAERPEDTPRTQDAPPEQAERSEDGTDRAPEGTSPPADRDTRGAPDGTPRG